MTESIVGQFWTKNEGDILEETIIDSLKHVDSLFIADGQSMDNSWEIIKSLKLRYPDKIEHIQQESEIGDRAQRTSLLNKIRERYRPEDTWVQIIESDMFLLDTDLREITKTSDLAITWQTLNAVRFPGTWKNVDTYPNWNSSIRTLMPYVHWMEVMLYTFRPLPKLKYDQDIWRPWPKGWTYYTDKPVEKKKKEENSPLLLHVGYRGPTHFYNKYKNMGAHHTKYTNWRLKHVESVESTVYFFNGVWNDPNKIFPASREGWINWLRGTNAPLAVNRHVP